MKSKPLALPPLILFMFCSSLNGENFPAPSLKEAFTEHFYIGAAIGQPLFREKSQATLGLVGEQFNSVSPTNMLKWSSFNPEPGVYDHELPDAFVRYGLKHEMYIVGHVLFWHNQTPEWVYNDKGGRPLDREGLLKRMRSRVRVVANRYEEYIDAWDVVNESIIGTGDLRKSKWTQIIGDDFIEQAFRIAEEELPGGVELLYNDYSMAGVKKRQAVVNMIWDLKEKNVRIDGVGMQGHWTLNHPSIAEIEASILAFWEAGVDVHITELDVDVLPREKGMFGADVNRRRKLTKSNNPYRKGLPEEVEERLARRYADIFQLFLKHREKIKRVTFWGATDADSWLNNWPVRGRTNHPLLFDREGRPKPAFYSVTGLPEADSTP